MSSSTQAIGPIRVSGSATGYTNVVLAGLMEDLGVGRREQLPLEGERAHVDLARLDASRRVHQEGTEEWRKNQATQRWVAGWKNYARENDDGQDEPDMGYGQLQRAHRMKNANRPGGDPEIRHAAAFGHRNERDAPFHLGLPTTGFNTHQGSSVGQLPEAVMRRRRGRGHGAHRGLPSNETTTAKSLAESLNLGITRDTQRRPQQQGIESGVWGPGGNSSTQSMSERPGIQSGVSSMPAPATRALPPGPSSMTSIANPLGRGTNINALSVPGASAEPAPATRTLPPRPAQLRSTVSRKVSKPKALAKPNKPPQSQKAETDATRISLADPASFMSASAKIFSAAKEATASNAAALATSDSTSNEMPPKTIESARDEVAPTVTDSAVGGVAPTATESAPTEVDNIQSPASEGNKAAPEGLNDSSQPVEEVPASPPVEKLLDFDVDETATTNNGRDNLSSYMRAFGIETELDLMGFDFVFRCPVKESPVEDEQSSKDVLPDNFDQDKDSKEDSKQDLNEHPEEDSKETGVESNKCQDEEFNLLIDFSEEVPNTQPVKGQSFQDIEREFLGLDSEMIDINKKIAALRVQSEDDISKEVPKKDTTESYTQQAPKEDKQVSSIAEASHSVEAPKLVKDTGNISTVLRGDVSASSFADNSSAESSPRVEASEVAKNTGNNSAVLRGGVSASRFADNSSGTSEARQRNTIRPRAPSSNLSASRYAYEPLAPLNSERPPPRARADTTALKPFTGELEQSRWAGSVTQNVVATTAAAGGGAVGASLVRNGQGQPPIITPPPIYKPVTIRNPQTGEVIHEYTPQKKEDDKKDDNSPKSRWTTRRFT